MKQFTFSCLLISLFLSTEIYAVACLEIPLGNDEYQIVIPPGYTECEIDEGGGGSSAVGLIALGALVYFISKNSDSEIQEQISGFMQGEGFSIKETKYLRINFLELNSFKPKAIKQDYFNENKFNILSIKLKY